MNILICDDEQKYIDDIQKHVSIFMDKHGYDENIDTFLSGEEAIESCKNNSYDIAFLDIEIGNIKGTEIAKILKENNKHVIIFIITAYDKYLDEAMDLNVLRFLTKPINVKRLNSGLEKAIALIDNSIVDVYLKKDSEIIKVPANNIIYIEIVDRCTKIVTDKDVYMSSSSIKYWKEKLTASFFYQVHTSFIINMKFITKYSRELVELKYKYLIPIAYRKRSKFRNYFLNYFSGR